MPVHVEKRGDKWRIIGPDGKIEKTSKGHDRDGGGHSSKAKAMAQMRAMNASKHR